MCSFLRSGCTAPCLLRNARRVGTKSTVLTQTRRRVWEFRDFPHKTGWHSQSDHTPMFALVLTT